MQPLRKLNKSGMADEESLMTDSGLPYLTEDEKDAGQSGACKGLIGLIVAPRLVGAIVASAIYFPAKDWYDGTILRLGVMLQPGAAPLTMETAQGTLLWFGFVFCALGVFNILAQVLNILPMRFKSQVMKSDSGNLRANMLVYKVAGVDGERHEVVGPDGNMQRLPYVVMEDEGELGEYNRANRALQHFNENAGVLPTLAVAGGFVFPLAVLVLASLYAICRIWYQIAYAEGGYGIGCCKHGVPFMCHSVLLAPVFEMLVWLIGVRMLMGV